MIDREKLARAMFDQSTLEKCPFCRGTATLEYAGYGDWAVICHGCGARVQNDLRAVDNAIGPRKFDHPVCTIGIKIQNVVEKWNRRSF